MKKHLSDIFKSQVDAAEARRKSNTRRERYQEAQEAMRQGMMDKVVSWDFSGYTNFITQLETFGEIARRTLRENAEAMGAFLDPNRAAVKLYDSIHPDARTLIAMGFPDLITSYQDAIKSETATRSEKLAAAAKIAGMATLMGLGDWEGEHARD